jgi:hypothetical protein
MATHATHRRAARGRRSHAGPTSRSGRCATTSRSPTQASPSTSGTKSWARTISRSPACSPPGFIGMGGMLLEGLGHIWAGRSHRAAAPDATRRFASSARSATRRSADRLCCEVLPPHALGGALQDLRRARLHLLRMPNRGHRDVQRPERKTRLGKDRHADADDPRRETPRTNTQCLRRGSPRSAAAARASSESSSA